MGEAERPPSLDEDEGREGRRVRLRPPTGVAGAVKMTDEMLGMVDVLLSIIFTILLHKYGRFCESCL